MAKKKRKSGRSYEGILLELISQNGWRPETLLDSFENSRQYKDQLFDRYRALAAHYGIRPGDPDPANRLLLYLAKDHVPGFKVREPSKKANAWTYDKLMNLRRLIIRERFYNQQDTPRANPIGISQAVQNLAKRGLPKPFEKLGAETLRRRFTEARKAKKDKLRYRMGRRRKDDGGLLAHLLASNTLAGMTAEKREELLGRIEGGGLLPPTAQ